MSEWVGVHLYAPTHAAHAVIPPLPPPAPPALPCRAVLPPCLAPPLPLPQNQFLQPNAAMVERLASQLEAKKIGVVAHFYMDPEVQGVLSSAVHGWGGRAGGYELVAQTESRQLLAAV